MVDQYNGPNEGANFSTQWGSGLGSHGGDRNTKKGINRTKNQGGASGVKSTNKLMPSNHHTLIKRWEVTKTEGKRGSKDILR